MKINRQHRIRIAPRDESTSLNGVPTGLWSGSESVTRHRYGPVGSLRETARQKHGKYTGHVNHVPLIQILHVLHSRWGDTTKFSRSASVTEVRSFRESQAVHFCHGTTSVALAWLSQQSSFIQAGEPTGVINNASSEFRSGGFLQESRDIATGEEHLAIRKEVASWIAKEWTLLCRQESRSDLNPGRLHGQQKCPAQ